MWMSHLPQQPLWAPAQVLLLVQEQLLGGAGPQATSQRRHMRVVVVQGARVRVRVRPGEHLPRQAACMCPRAGAPRAAH